MFVLNNKQSAVTPKPARGAMILAFYGGLIVLLGLVVTGTLGAVLPGPISSSVAYNSEAYFFAVVIAGWIHLRLAVPVISRRGAVVVLAGAGLLAVGGLLLALDLPSRVATLNEAAFAAAILVVYIVLPRPLPRVVPWSIFVGISVIAGFAVATGGDSWVIDQAEAVGFIALLPIALDVVDRGILDDQARTRPAVRYAFYAALFAEPVIVSALGTTARQGDGGTALTLEFLGRIHESFFGVLLICLFFAVALGRTGRDSGRWVPCAEEA